MEDYNFSKKALKYSQELQNLTYIGFKGSSEFSVEEFSEKELSWAFKFAKACGTPIKSINTKRSSYRIKHIAERWAKIMSHDEVNYISNGTLILAMVIAGFQCRRLPDSLNAQFNVSERIIKSLEKDYYLNNMIR